jgi:hypothetical protein
MKHIFWMGLVVALGSALAAPRACDLVTELQVGNSFETKVSKGVASAPKGAVPTTACTYSRGNEVFVTFSLATHPATAGAEAAARAAQKVPAAIAIDDLYGLTVFIPSNRAGHSLLVTQFQRYYLRIEVRSTDEKAYTQAKALLRTAIKRLSSIVNPRKPSATQSSPSENRLRPPRP